MHASGGTPYFYNSATGATQWQRPKRRPHAPEPAAGDAQATQSVATSGTSGGPSDGSHPFEVVEPYYKNSASKDPYYERLVNRRLADEAVTDPDDEAVDNTEFDTFRVRITKPIHYQIDEALMKGLIKKGAFRIEDGREATHGPIFVKDFQLIHPEPSRAKPAEAASDGDSQRAPPTPPVSEESGKANAGGAVALAAATGGHAADADAAEADGGDKHRPPFVARVPPEEVLGMAAGGVIGAMLLIAAVGRVSRRTPYSAVASTDVQEPPRDFA